MNTAEQPQIAGVSYEIAKMHRVAESAFLMVGRVYVDDVDLDDKNEVLWTVWDGDAFLWDPEQDTTRGPAQVANGVSRLTIGDYSSDPGLEFIPDTMYSAPTIWSASDLKPLFTFDTPEALLEAYQWELPVSAVGEIVQDAPGPEVIAGDEGLLVLYANNGSILARKEYEIPPRGVPAILSDRSVLVTETNQFEAGETFLSKVRVVPAPDEFVDLDGDDPYHFEEEWRVKVGVGFARGPPVIADLDGDGEHEIVVDQTHRQERGMGPGFVVFDQDGQRSIEADREGFATPLTLADLTGDGLPDIVATYVQTHADDIHTPWLAEHSAQIRGYSYEEGALDFLGSYDTNGRSLFPTACDLDGDGKDELVVVEKRPPNPRTREQPWGEGTLTILRDFEPIWQHEFALGSPDAATVADHDGDGRYDLFLLTGAGVGYAFSPTESDAPRERHLQEREWFEGRNMLEPRYQERFEELLAEAGVEDEATMDSPFVHSVLLVIAGMVLVRLGRWKTAP